MQQPPEKPKVSKQTEAMFPDMPKPQETLQEKIDRFNQKFPNSRELKRAIFWNPDTKNWETPGITEKPSEIDKNNMSNKKS